MQKINKELPKRQRAQINVVPKKQEAIAIPVAAPILEYGLPALASLWLGSQAAKNIKFNPAVIGTLAFDKVRQIYNTGHTVPANKETVVASDATRVAKPAIFPKSRTEELSIYLSKKRNKNKAKPQIKTKIEEQTDTANVTPKPVEGQVNQGEPVTPTNNVQSDQNPQNNKQPDQNPKNKLKEKLQNLKNKASNVVKSKGAIVSGGAALGGAADYGRILTENSYGNNLDWQDMVLPSMLMPLLESGLSSETQQLRELERQQRKAESLKNQRERIEQLKQKSPVINSAPQQNTEQTNFENALRSIINDADSLTK